MSEPITHTCYCGKVYDCPQCSNGAKWACSTVNDDEDRNMCDDCLEKLEYLVKDSKS